jgi:hypothetical protein
VSSSSGEDVRGQILDILPIITDENGSWVMKVGWGPHDGRPAYIEQLRVGFEDDVDIVIQQPKQPNAGPESPSEQPLFGQKRVSATSIVEGDRIFWGHPNGDLMMDVTSVAEVVNDGIPCKRFAGMTFALNRGGVGQAMTGSSRGTTNWTIPTDRKVDKQVPWDEADHDADSGSGVGGGGDSGQDAD